MSLIRANEILCHNFLAVQTATPTATRITAMIAVTMSMTRLLVVADRASHADFSQFSQEWETRSTPETPGMSFSLFLAVGYDRIMEYLCKQHVLGILRLKLKP